MTTTRRMVACHPTSKCVYTHSSPGEKRLFYSSLALRYSSETHWKVHMGDVVAFRTSNESLSENDIQHFEPNHYQKASPHWKIGLVISLFQVSSPKSLQTLLKIQCLEKALDTPFTKELKMTYRPWSRNASHCKLPHVVLSTSTIQDITPDRLLPICIQMLDQADFTQGVALGSEDNRNLKFHCPKRIVEEKLINIDYSFGSLKNKYTKVPPKPLQEAWKLVDLYLQEKAMLPGLIKAYFISRDEQKKERKRLIDEKKRRLIQEENLALEKRKALLQKQQQQQQRQQQFKHSIPIIHNKHNRHNKRVRIQEPGEKENVKQQAKRRKSSLSDSNASIKKSSKITPANIAKKSTTQKSKRHRKQKHHSRVVEPMTDPLLRLQKKEYFDSLDLEIDPDVLMSPNKRLPSVFPIKVGQVVAVRVDTDEDEEKESQNQRPFSCSWALAQILGLYRYQDQWYAMAKWFFRCDELPTQFQSLVTSDPGFDLKNGIIEGMQVDAIELDAILPAFCNVTGDAVGWHDNLSYQKVSNGLVKLHLSCRHLLRLFKNGNADTILPIRDWPGTFSMKERGLRLLPKTLANAYHQAIYGDISTMNSQEEDKKARNTSKTNKKKKAKERPLQIAALQQPLYERWNCQFHDGVNLEVAQLALVQKVEHNSLTVQVGNVVPIQLDYYNSSNQTKIKNENAWHPFKMPWSPAQIVSLYQKQESGEWMAQVRWFCRYNDLIDLQKQALPKLYHDKPHVVFETEQYSHVSLQSVLPGRICLTSGFLEEYNLSTSSKLPWIPLFCGHICLDDELDVSDDWTNYDISLGKLPSPLMRGLTLDPVSREHKDRIVMLTRYYQKSIAKRTLKEEESKVLQGFQQLLQQQRSAILQPVPTMELDPSQVSVVIGAEIFASDHQEFIRSLKLTLPVEVLAKPSKLALRQRKHRFACHIGDVVAFHNPKQAISETTWDPFTIKWSFGQILSIYTCNKKQQVMVELRQLYRPCELPKKFRPWLPQLPDNGVFESDCLFDIPANHLLSLAQIGSNPRILLSYQSQYFYLAQGPLIQPIVSKSTIMKKRGLRLSNWAFKYPGLAQALSNACIGNNDETVMDVAGWLLQSATKTASPLGLGIRSSSNNNVFFYPQVTLPSHGHLFEGKDLFFSDKSYNEWTVQVGNFVAVISSASSQQELYPFTKPWIPAQVLAVFLSEEPSASPPSWESLFVELRILQFTDTKCMPRPLQATPRVVTVSIKKLLGPLFVLSSSSLPFGEKWQLATRQMPCIPCCWTDKETILDLKTLLLKYSKICSTPGQDISNILAALDMDEEETLLALDDTEDEEEPSETTVWTSQEPMHKDLSQMRAYYKELSLIPQQRPEQRHLTVAPTVTITMGDAVVVAHEGSKRYPYDCNWSVGEVVTIWKDFKSAKAMQKEDSSSNNGIQIEIRWLYEHHDLQGHSAVDSTKSTLDMYPEVFETDHVQVVDGVNLLTPAQLLDDSASSFLEETNGIVHTFVCRRFWSTTRKALIPCGTLKARQQRGWIYSRELPMEAQKKYSKNVSFQTIITTDNDHELSWKDRMDRAISKLTLQDASKGVYERGEPLIGREKELYQLLTFFRAAIRGEAGQGGVRSSMFIGGPPGVGKTACVRAAISQLCQEQAQGELPSFHFISLNGMEVRHPCETYAKFWEALTGHKHIGSHQAAGEKLKRYFTSSKSGTKQEKSVTVLLLDEIDYLITENQTVLYDFFDWPKLASETTNGKRLVVLGISNTLNLIERLLPSVQSRLGKDECTFASYELKDTIAILKNKINEASPDMKLFEEDAILLASRKIAGLSGDIRKAFQICRAAAELVLQKWESESEPQDLKKITFPTVRISDVQKASRESFNVGLSIATSFLRPFQALLLISLASLYRTTGRETGFDIVDIMTKMEAIAGSSGDPQYNPPPSFGETIHLLNSLGESNLVGLKTDKSSLVSFRASRGGSGGAWPVVRMLVQEGELLRGFKKTPHKSLFEKNLPSIF